MQMIKKSSEYLVTDEAIIKFARFIEKKLTKQNNMFYKITKDKITKNINSIIMNQIFSGNACFMELGNRMIIQCPTMSFEINKDTRTVIGIEIN